MTNGLLLALVVSLILIIFSFIFSNKIKLIPGKVQGAVEMVVCLMALREQWLPPETAFDIPDPACSFPVVRAPQDARLDVALSNSFGFGGVNATLIFRRWA